MSTFIFINIFVVLLGVSIAFLNFFTNLPIDLSSIWLHTTEDDSPLLVVAILSARSNFKQREAIRNFWGKDIQEWKNIKYKFFIGQGCHIPILDRQDELSCNERSRSPLKEGNILEDSCIETLIKNKAASNNCYKGFGFHIAHPLILSSIGVQRTFLRANEDLHVTFQDPEEVLDHIIFHNHSCSSIEDDYCFISLKEKFILPKYFEGEIEFSLSEELDTDVKSGCITSNNCLHFLYGKTDEGYEKFEEGRCSHILAKFSLLDEKSFKKHFNEKSQRASVWSEEQRLLEARIKVEADVHNDIVQLPSLVDVYRNLPLKTLEAIKWSHENYPQSPVLKIDDDSKANISLIAQFVSRLTSQESELNIWSHFYYNRAVPRFGKWADSDFKGVTYPPFPCGSGYLLSGRLVSLLSQMSPFLRPFQGEDISIGIWTEVLQLERETVKKIHVKCWLPTTKCPFPYIVPELTPDQMVSDGR